MSEPTETKRRSLWPMVALVLFAAILILPLCTYQVRFREVAILTTFGSRSDEPIGPGLHAKLPWPIQKVHTFDTRLRLLSTRYTQNFTADQNTLVLTFLAAWSIDDPNQFLVSAGNIVAAERALTDLISTEKNIVIGSHPVRHLVSTDKDAYRFEQIEQEILDRVAPQAHSKYGIRVAYLGIEQINLPEAITDGVFSRMQAERENRASAIIREGERQASSIRTEAEGQRDRLLARARQEAQLIRSQADQEASAAYEVFNRDPEFHLFLQKLEALEATIGENDVLILDRKVSPYDLLEPINSKRTPEAAGQQAPTP